MRKYLEAIEIPPKGSPEAYMPEFIRLDATDKEEAQVLQDLRDMLDPDKQYIIRRHYCYHDEEPNKPCRIEAIS